MGLARHFERTIDPAKTMSQTKILPLGQSGFPYLRESGAIYVDKTEMIYKMALNPAKIFLARPRRFGKSLLVSALESLFRHGLKDFHGLAIEKLWNDKTYDVVRLDFSAIKNFSNIKEFTFKFQQLITTCFEKVGFSSKEDEDISLQLGNWLYDRPSGTLVILIDEYDAPLTSTLDNAILFHEVRQVLSNFYIQLKINSNSLRFLFLTGITKYSSASIFSEFNDFDDISLNPDYGTLLGYTEQEILINFSEHLNQACHILNLTQNELLNELRKYYNGFCFDELACTHVFCPWSVLKFLSNPKLGFKNYWYSSGGNASVLQKYLTTHALSDPTSYGEIQEVPLSDLENSRTYESLDARILLTQAGYLTIKDVGTDRWVQLGYPNQEVAISMAELYANELLKGKRLKKPGAPAISEVLENGSIEETVNYFNWIFNTIDYQDYPVTSESRCRTLLQILLRGGGIEAQAERHSALGRSDLEVDIGMRHWVFEFKFAKEHAMVESLLRQAVEQIQSRRYGEHPHGRSLIRVALVFDAEKRAFVRWATA